MKRYALLALSLLLFACAPEAPKAPPNIVFILADDLGYGDLGSYGQTQIQTPHLDRMAAEGMRFTDAYAGFTVCAPSRNVLMTGQHTGHARVRRNGVGPLLPEDYTVAEMLKEHGYTTALIGKWGLGEEESTGAPWRQGFDYFFGYLNQGHAHNYWPSHLWRNGEKVMLANEMVQSKRGREGMGVATKRVDYSHDLFATEALAFVDQNTGGPFFLYLAFTIPHANNQADPKNTDPGPGVIPEDMPLHRERLGMEVPDAGEYQERDWPGPQKGTAAMISRMDADIGRVLDRLKQHGLDENTIVFFSSDNGPHKEGGNDPFFFDSNGPVQGYKRSLHDGGIRVPMIVRWPGKVAPASTSDLPTYFADFLPTVAALVEADAPAGIDGANILPTLLGEPRDLADRFLYWGGTEGRPEAVRWGKWKAVREGPDQPLELFDLTADIGEENDVASEHPDVVKRIEDYIASAVTPE
ncbi:MAG: arylsulfatase [bacterium]|nr:arylsulfatase [bacterium]